MIKISPRIRDDPVVEIISPVTIDLSNSQIDMNVGLFEMVIMVDEMIRIVSISHCFSLVYKTIIFLGCRCLLVCGFSLLVCFVFFLLTITIWWFLFPWKLWFFLFFWSFFSSIWFCFLLLCFFSF